eukprot:Selendium_serpulae@DN6749_c0_g1_i1.p1
MIVSFVYKYKVASPFCTGMVDELIANCAIVTHSMTIHSIGLHARPWGVTQLEVAHMTPLAIAMTHLAVANTTCPTIAKTVVLMICPTTSHKPQATHRLGKAKQHLMSLRSERISRKSPKLS